MTSITREAQRRLQAFTFSSVRYSADATARWLVSASRRRGLCAATRQRLRDLARDLVESEDTVAAVARSRKRLEGGL